MLDALAPFPAIWSLMATNEKMLFACLLTLALALFMILLDGTREKPAIPFAKDILDLGNHISAIYVHVGDLAAEIDKLKEAKPSCGLDAFNELKPPVYTPNPKLVIEPKRHTKMVDPFGVMEAGLKAMGAQSIEEPVKRKPKRAGKKRGGR